MTKAATFSSHRALRPSIPRTSSEQFTYSNFEIGKREEPIHPSPFTAVSHVANRTLLYVTEFEQMKSSTDQPSRLTSQLTGKVMSFTDRDALLDVGTIAIRNFSNHINQKALLSTETSTSTTQELMETTAPKTQQFIETTTPTTGEFVETTTPEIGVSRDLTSFSSSEATGLRTTTGLEILTTPESSFKRITSAKDETTALNTGVEGEASEAAVYMTHRQTEPDQVIGAAREPDAHATYSTAQPGKPAERTTESKIVTSTSDMYEFSTYASAPQSPVTTGMERDHPLGTTLTMDNLYEEQKGAKSNNFHPDESELQHSILEYEVSCTQAGYNSITLLMLT